MAVPFVPMEYCPNCRLAARPHHYESHFGKVYKVCNACGDRQLFELPVGLKGWMSARRYARWLNSAFM